MKSSELQESSDDFILEYHFDRPVSVDKRGTKTFSESGRKKEFVFHVAKSRLGASNAINNMTHQ